MATSLVSNQRTVSMASVVNPSSPGEDSPVMNETLSVIQEHITDMNTPRQSLLTLDRSRTNDSGSDYSAQLDHRLSYITGHETDEEEEEAHSRAEVLKWSPAQVAEYLNEVGVDQLHCKVFVEQEISGEVLLGMDQASLFIKDLELGSVGRRLRTWHKIKALQDEAREPEQAQRQSRMSYGKPEGAREAPSGSPSSPPPTTALPRIPGLILRSNSRAQTPPDHPHGAQKPPKRPDRDSPRSAGVEMPDQDGPTRPSAASVRQMNHSRRHSSVDFAMGGIAEVHSDGSMPKSPALPQGTSHRKQASFDRNWTMGNASPTTNGRPAPATRRESTGAHKQTSSSDQAFGGALRSSAYVNPPSDFDRGYMSGGEAENRKSRNLLKKRESSGPHMRTSSYTEEQRQRSATAHSRQSRYGSADSIRNVSQPIMTGPTPRASQLYFNRDAQGRLPKLRDANTAASLHAANPVTSPTVTKLEYEGTSSRGSESSASLWGKKASGPPTPLVSSHSSVQMANPSSKPRSTGLRAISDAVTGTEKAGLRSPTEVVSSPTKDSPIQSPSPNDGTSTPSSSKNMDRDSTDSTGNSATPQVGTSSTTAVPRRKPKKETSAYIRGLERKTPAEQMVNCDYSGWMKKKNHKLMTTWKPRLFVLRGRRLSYYYSEKDDQEKGLIDISSHRVLPANADRITGLHATLTGASNSPTSPQNANMPTIAATEAAAQPPVVPQRAGGDNIFIFKLVPPRMGLSKAVNFTKPTVHYFAVDNVVEGRLWMAALMKATIDRDESKPMTTTYTQQTISLTRARQLQQLPLALKELDEKLPVGRMSTPNSEKVGLNLKGVEFDADAGGDDSGVSGMGKQSEDTKKTNSIDATSTTTTSKVSVDTGGSERPVT